MNRDRSHLYRLIVLSCIIPLSIFLKWVQYTFLPAKYFYDSAYILTLMRFPGLRFIEGSSYNNTALLFQTLNVFGISSLLGWSILITAIADLFLFSFFFKLDISDMQGMAASFCVLGVLNIYVFNLSKEIIQLCVFAAIWCVSQRRRLSYRWSVCLCMVLLYAESVFYRFYYLLTAFFMMILAILFPRLLKSGKRTGRLRKTILLFIAVFLILWIFLAVCRVLKPAEYQNLMQIRNRLTIHREGRDASQTLILNLLADNGNHLLFLINYIINGFRMLFPVELLFRGVYYWPFIFFQLLCTSMFIYNLLYYQRLEREQKLELCVMCAYLLTAFFFEPDFGSFIRHEAATAPVLLPLLLCNQRKNREVLYAAGY